MRYLGLRMVLIGLLAMLALVGLLDPMAPEHRASVESHSSSSYPVIHQNP